MSWKVIEETVARGRDYSTLLNASGRLSNMKTQK